MTAPIVTICRDADDLARRAADLFVRVASEDVRDHGRCTVALSGGSTPEKTYALLARPELAARIDWPHVPLFFSDERLVPHDDPRSSFALAERSLLHAVPTANVFPVPTDRPGPECAAAYAATLAQALGVPPNGPPPRFDLVLLGLGDDGHTASLFPGAPALDVRDAWVTASPPGRLPPPVERITFTFPVLCAARRIVFLVAGAGKATVLRDVLEGNATPHTHPAAGAAPDAGTVTWLVDETAAQLLTRRG